MFKLIDLSSVAVGLLAALVAIWQFLIFITFKDARGLPDMMAGVNHLWLAIGAAVVACACAILFYTRHNGPTEEIHITR